MRDMHYKVVLWDFDGTLVDTSEGIFRSLEYAFRQLGTPAPGRDVLRRFIGPPLLYSFQTYIGMSYEEAKRAVLVFRDDYEAGGMYRSRVYDGLPELIARLRQNGVKTAVATLKPEATAKQLLHHFGMEGLFDACTGNTPDENDQTTKADIIRRTMRRLEWTDCSSMVLIGDSVYDAQGAREVGIDFIAAAYGFGIGARERTALDCRFVAEMPRDLNTFFLQDKCGV